MARGYMKQRSPGSWTLSVSLGRDPVTGKRKRAWTTFHGNKTDAGKELTRLLGKADKGGVVVTGKSTLTEYIEAWLEKPKVAGLRPSTLQGYRSVIKCHILPNLGAIPIAKLTARDVDRLHSEMISKGLTGNTARHARVVLGKILQAAERDEVVERNVVRMTDPPEIKAFNVEPPDLATMTRLLVAADTTPFGAVFRLMAYTGLRRSEALALRWSHVHLDLELPILSVVESVTRLNDGSLKVAEPKSSSGRRAVDLDPTTVALLRSHRARQLERILSLGGIYEDAALVFADEAGRLIDPDRLTRAWKALAKREGCSGVRLHDLRHFHASELIRGGAHPKVVQSRLGHATAGFTLSRYGHLSPGMQAVAASAFAERMAEASK